MFCLWPKIDIMTIYSPFNKPKGPKTTRPEAIDETSLQKEIIQTVTLSNRLHLKLTKTPLHWTTLRFPKYLTIMPRIFFQLVAMKWGNRNNWLSCLLTVVKSLFMRWFRPWRHKIPLKVCRACTAIISTNTSVLQCYNTALIAWTPLQWKRGLQVKQAGNRLGLSYGQRG